MAPYEGDVGTGWPEATGKGVDVDRDKLKDIAKALQQDLDELSGFGKGTGRSLQSGERGLVTMTELGNYPAAQGLAGTTKNAYDVITSEYEEFLRGYKAVIDGILGTRDRYQRAEDANVQNVGEYDGTTGNHGGTTGNATYAG